MQSVFNTALLARLRRQTAETSLTPDRTYPANTQSYDQNTGAIGAGDSPGERSADDLDPLLLPPGEDPDANIDPDDRGMRQNNGSLFHALPDMPAEMVDQNGAGSGSDACEFNRRSDSFRVCWSEISQCSTGHVSASTGRDGSVFIAFGRWGQRTNAIKRYGRHGVRFHSDGW